MVQEFINDELVDEIAAASKLAIETSTTAIAAITEGNAASGETDI